MILAQINEDLLGVSLNHTTLDMQYKDAFITGIERWCRERDFSDTRMVNFDLPRLADALVRSRDELLHVSWNTDSL
jgi:hypothetical protein